MTAFATSQAEPRRIDYAGRRFRPRGDAGPSAAMGVYHQENDLVWADFSGPTVQVGRLVGTCSADGVIVAAYCMVIADGRSIAGTLLSTPTVLDDGRIELIERWRRMDGTSGVSHLEEVAD